jgi:signal transduction histidine kinase/ActR/RegA family two-component response regulator
MDREVLTRYFTRIEPQLILFILYFVVGRVGLSIHPVNTFATFIWPASALALCTIMLFGYRLWPAILLGAFAVNASLGANLLVAAGIGFGNMLEAVAGAYFLKHIVNFDASLSHMRDNLGIIVTAFFAPVLSATTGVTSLWLGGNMTGAEIFSSWGAWWSGDALSILILSPLLLKWVSRPAFYRSTGQYVELFLSICTVAITAFFVFWTPGVQSVYYLFIPLTWVALRTGPRGTSLAIVVAASIAIAGTLLGKGPYANTGLFQLGIFIGTLGSLFLIFMATVEERKNSQKELSRHVEELEQALSKISSEDEAKKNFLAILAHELRNPLAAMLSSIELLRLQKPAGEETSGLVRTIGEHVQAMRSMLDDVLDISRISRNKLMLRKEIVSLDSILNHSIESTQAIVRDRHHALSITKPSTPLFVEVDPIRIEQIVVNVLNNAAKYTNPGGKLEIRTTSEHGMAVMRFKDNGVGISKSMQKRIFEPFFQVRRGTLATEGLGVGLPLTKQLVEMHGGTIEVKSDGEGKGSEFIVRLPLVSERRYKAAKAVPSSPSNKKLRFVKHKRSILVVDDNEAAANALGRLLELRGHEVKVAYTGLAGVDAARTYHPDLLILDIGLPDIDGYEVVRRLKDDPELHAAIIALTGYGQAEDKERALAAGFHHHLTKPVGLKELERAFKKVAHVYEEA